MIKKTIIFFLTVVGTLRVMAQIPTPVPYQPVTSITPITAPPPAATAPAPAATPAASGLLNGYVPDATYKLRAGDTVSFQILEDRVWNSLDVPKPLVVTDSGELDVPYIGRVMAADKTCKQLADEIKDALEKDYYNKATVVLSLNVANRMWGRVYLSGQVHTQGGLDVQMNENLTAGQAILRAGGFADFANKNKVKLIRSATVAGGGNKSFELDMEQILEKGKLDKDMLLQPGDQIYVPSRLVNF